MAITFTQFLDRRSAKKKEEEKKAMLFYLFLSPLQVAPFSFFAHCAVSIIDCDGFC